MVLHPFQLHFQGVACRFVDSHHHGEYMGLVLKLSKDSVIQVGDRVQVLYKGNRKTIVVDGQIELSFNEKKVWIDAPESVQIVRESLDKDQ